MKTKKSVRKLALHRSTIANLDKKKLELIKGGDGSWIKSLCICPASYSACDCGTTA